jgi:predicted PurR-regulated permease PerM
MEIGFFRDLVIIISGVVFTVALVVIISVVLGLNKRIREVAETTRDVMDKLQASAEDLQLITSYARQEVALPLAQLAGFIQGLGQSLQSFTQMFRRF